MRASVSLKTPFSRPSRLEKKDEKLEAKACVPGASLAGGPPGNERDEKLFFASLK